jgi:hypothetical protein
MPTCASRLRPVPSGCVAQLARGTAVLIHHLLHHLRWRPSPPVMMLISNAYLKMMTPVSDAGLKR